MLINKNRIVFNNILTQKSSSIFPVSPLVRVMLLLISWIILNARPLVHVLLLRINLIILIVRLLTHLLLL